MTIIKLRFGLTPTQWDKLCLRCGECCKTPGTATGYCIHLTFDENHKARCNVYKNRLWRPCGNGSYVCNPINSVAHRAVNCPYNKYFGESKP